MGTAAEEELSRRQNPPEVERGGLRAAWRGIALRVALRGTALRAALRELFCGGMRVQYSDDSGVVFRSRWQPTWAELLARDCYDEVSFWTEDRGLS